MQQYTATPDYYNDYIAHFNPFHDPRNGQFTTGHGGGSITRLQKKAAKANKKADKLNAQLEKEKYKQEIENIRNTAKTDEEKDKRIREVEDSYAKKQLSKIDQQKISKEVKRARETGMYNMEFLERNLDLDPVTEEQMKGKALDNAYRKFLEDELKKNNK